MPEAPFGMPGGISRLDPLKPRTPEARPIETGLWDRLTSALNRLVGRPGGSEPTQGDLFQQAEELGVQVEAVYQRGDGRTVNQATDQRTWLEELRFRVNAARFTKMVEEGKLTPPDTSPTHPPPGKGMFGI